MWTPDSFLARPEDAIAFAWQSPMRELATRIGISDVALRKRLGKQGIVTPPQGHWNRVRAGRSVTRPASPPARRPGEDGRVRLDARFRGHVAETGPMSADGPFASKAVPEDLEELRVQELAAIGRVAAPHDLTRAHYGLARLLRAEEARRAYCQENVARLQAGCYRARMSRKSRAKPPSPFRYFHSAPEVIREVVML